MKRKRSRSGAGGSRSASCSPRRPPSRSPPRCSSTISSRRWRRSGISEFFIGIILIPLIGNLAEHMVGVTLAYKNKMDFSLITSIGSATQIALFAVPVLVFFGLIVDNPVTLVFSPLEVVAVAVASLHRRIHRARRQIELGRGSPAHQRLPDPGHRLLLPHLGPIAPPRPDRPDATRIRPCCAFPGRS